MEPVTAQKINDLRSRILANEAAGKPLNEGIPDAELKEALNALRARRATITQAAPKKAGGKPGRIALPDTPIEQLNIGELFKRKKVAAESPPPAVEAPPKS